MNRDWWVWPGPSSRRHQADRSIFVTTLILLVIGLVIQYAIGPAVTAGTDGISRNFYFYRHFASILIGFASLYIAWKVPIKSWIRLSPWLLAAGAALSLITIAIDGIASRWIQIGFFSFQPVEVIKLAMILGGAAFILQARQNNNFTSSWRPVSQLLYALVGATFLVVILQRDFGSWFVIAAVVMLMLFVGGFSLKLFGMGVLIASLLASVFILSTPYRRDRLNTFLNPQADCSDAGYHACQAVIGVGSGGLFGRGIGKSVQVYGYLPEASNDSIFAVYAEIIGFIGSLLLLALYYRLFKSIYIIAQRSELLLRLIAVGILTWFSLQSAMNIGAMIGLLPLKGITLPFVSYGGSSLMLVMFATGIILQISAYTVYSYEKTEDNTPGRRRVRRTRYATRYNRPGN